MILTSKWARSLTNNLMSILANKWQKMNILISELWIILMIICIKSTYNSVQNWINFMACNYVGLLKIAGHHWSTYGVSFDHTDISDCVHLFDVNIVQFLQILFNLRLRQLFIHLEDKHIVIHLLTWAMQDHFMLYKFVLRMLSWIVFIFRNLSLFISTSKP